MEKGERRHPGGSPTAAEVDWQQLAELCLGVAAELHDLAPKITDRIRSELSDYAVVPREEHEYYVHEQTRELLIGLAARRPPTREQTALAWRLGGQRALQGVPAEVLLTSYHIGYREIWNALVTKADACDTELTAGLVQLVTLVWTWLREVTGATTEAHSEALSSHQAGQINLTHRFLEALRSGEAHSDDAAYLARTLSFDPDGTFQAVCAPSSSWSDEELNRLQRQFRLHRGVVHSASQGAVTVVVCQDTATDVVTSTIRRQHPRLPIGVGLRRRGLAGAEASIVDGERALALAIEAGGAVDFRDDWLFATLLAHRRRLAPLLQAEKDVASLYPHLAEAVLAYADQGFSVTAAARAMHIHPNTVAYRLDRWRQLTGWAPRTLDGLMRSLLCLRLFPSEHHSDTSAPT